MTYRERSTVLGPATIQACRTFFKSDLFDFLCCAEGHDYDGDEGKEEGTECGRKGKDRGRKGSSGLLSDWTSGR